MDKEFFIEIEEKLIGFLWDIGPTVIKAVIALLIGIVVIKIVKRILNRIMRKANTELSLRTFVDSLATFILYGLLFATIGIIIGIEATSFIAAFGGAAIAVGLALQGSLANFAGGVLILVFKPFRVGDLIKVNEVLGFVEKIDILYTRVTTYDGRMITMPNGNVANSDIDNRTINQTRRVEITIRVGHDEDIDQVISICENVMKSHAAIMKDPEADAWLDEIEDYCLRFTVRGWTEWEEYWPVYWEQLAVIKKELAKAGIKIAIPKREINYSHTKERNSTDAPE
ncbi:mechanosensitive ion channel protein MscS [Brumimicrobium salinarum]|uniref:Mechanosensitive ion channel protein MscS n=1 Tax=Brumimicrobium salinarum TaxID=2058658 RepID=A0A2I0QZH1_9FLAO|nr:mechanosensitive ion channel domain-containing protein [Brumimicrobium salinarum]PKR79726.1 mechanosensitive ion channel protein MscS [Brumimicrobium salinarum]